jgi:hypothetical protein
MSLLVAAVTLFFRSPGTVSYPLIASHHARPSTVTMTEQVVTITQCSSAWINPKSIHVDFHDIHPKSIQGVFGRSRDPWIGKMIQVDLMDHGVIYEMGYWCYGWSLEQSKL